MKIALWAGKNLLKQFCIFVNVSIKQGAVSCHIQDICVHTHASLKCQQQDQSITTPRFERIPLLVSDAYFCRVPGKSTGRLTHEEEWRWLAGGIEYDQDVTGQAHILRHQQWSSLILFKFYCNNSTTGILGIEGGTEGQILQSYCTSSTCTTPVTACNTPITA